MGRAMTTTRETADHAELAGCPFCAGKAVLRDGMGEFWVCCDDCGASGYMRSRQDRAVRDWNARPNEAALLSEIAALRDEMERSLPSISLDGEHAISDHRRWLARQLLDSRLDDGEAYSIVAYHPAITDLRTTQAERQRDDAFGLLRELADGRSQKNNINEYDDLSVRASTLLATHGADQ